MVSMR